MNLKQKLGVGITAIGLMSGLYAGISNLRTYDGLCESGRQMEISNSGESTREFNKHLKKSLVYHGLYVGSIITLFGGTTLFLYDRFKEGLRKNEK